MTVTPAHLGGHMNMSWVDEPVLDYLTARYNIRSVLDVGCGLGGMIDLALQRGIASYGVDGDPQVERPGVFIHDFTEGPFEKLPYAFDLIWCVEFVEHVEAQYIDNFLTTFDAGRVLYLTHALPGQGGHHHVNEQNMFYWTAILAERGWQVDIEATQWVRDNGAIPFSKMSGLVFTKTDPSL
jgi:SAM-dependent methyltransferase